MRGWLDAKARRRAARAHLQGKGPRPGEEDGEPLGQTRRQRKAANLDKAMTWAMGLAGIDVNATPVSPSPVAPSASTRRVRLAAGAAASPTRKWDDGSSLHGAGFGGSIELSSSRWGLEIRPQSSRCAPPE